MERIIPHLKAIDFILTGYFNTEKVETVLETFLSQHDSKNLVKGGACFKSPKQPSCLELFLVLSFQHTISVFKGLSGFHKMILTVLKKTFVKSKLTEIN